MNRTNTHNKIVHIIYLAFTMQTTPTFSQKHLHLSYSYGLLWFRRPVIALCNSREPTNEGSANNITHFYTMANGQQILFDNIALNMAVSSIHTKSINRISLLRIKISRIWLH